MHWCWIVIAGACIFISKLIAFGLALNAMLLCNCGVFICLSKLIALGLKTQCCIAHIGFCVSRHCITKDTSSQTSMYVELYCPFALKLLVIPRILSQISHGVTESVQLQTEKR